MIVLDKCSRRTLLIDVIVCSLATGNIIYMCLNTFHTVPVILSSIAVVVCLASALSILVGSMINEPDELKDTCC